MKIFVFKSVIILVSFLSYGLVFSQLPSINENRPRIFVDQNRLDWLQNNINIPGDCKQTYDDMLYAYNNWWINDPELYIDGTNTNLWTWNWNSIWSGNQTQLTVFFYKISNQSIALQRCEYIAQQYITKINSTDFSSLGWSEKENLLRKMSDAGSILLDWCYNDLSPTVQDQLAQAHFMMTQEFVNFYLFSTEGNTSFVSSHNTWNHVLCNQNVLSLYNSSGLTNTQKNEVFNWFESIYNRHINNFIPVWSHYRDDDGGWNWGTAYSMWSLGDQYTLFENMRIGTNKNFFQDLNWVQNSINQYLYFIQPDRKSLHIGDGETELKADIVTYLNAKHYNDSRSIWLSQNYSVNTILTNTMEKYSKLLYKDFTIPLISQPSIPLDWFSDKVGIAVSRSSWQEDATMTTFFNSISKRAAHEHRDNNSFTIFKNSPLMIDSGYYDTYQGSHHNNYYSRTIAHNSICVFDANENYTNIGFPVSNDGGQIESPHLKNLTEINLPENQRGNWIQNANSNDYNYSVSDAQLSYDPNKLEKFRRRFLFIKPEKVIVLDHIELNSSNPNPLQLKWIGHFVNEPTINGSLTNTTIPNHIETYNGKDYFSSNGNGNIAIRTLFPLNSKTTLIGGEGYEYWVNGQNYEPISVPNPSQNVSGNWRIEVEPITVENNSIFLHTMDIGDNSNVATSGGIELESPVSIGVDWEDTIYFFSKDGEINKENHLLNNIEGNRTITLFATDLFPYSYTISVNGIEVETINSDTNGILKSIITLSSGNHTIEINQNPLNNQNFVFDSNDVIIFPNPIESKAIIKVKTNDYKKIEISIIDSYGKKVSCPINNFDEQIIIEKGNLPNGIYILKITENNKILGLKKIIIQ